MDIEIQDTDTNYIISQRVGYNISTSSVDTIYLQAINISYDVGVFTQVPDQPARIQATLPENLAYGDFLGFSSPKIKIDGIIDLSTYTTGTVPAPTTSGYLLVCLRLLQQIYKSGHTFTLTDKYSSDVYRIHTLTTADAVASLKVICSGLSVKVAKVDNESRFNYSIEFIEVRG